MSEINEAGYQSIRDFIENNWKYIELRDDTDSQITRVDITSDDRFSWTHSSGAQTLKIEGTVKGGDSDIGTGTTLKGSAIYEVSSGGDELHYAEDTAFTFEKSEDECNITHTIEVPEVV